MAKSIYNFHPTIADKPVFDADGPLEIQISAADCSAGKNKDPSKCAAALAVKRAIPAALSVRVHISRTYVEFKDKWLKYRTPEGLRTEMVAFDRGGEFTPGKFRLQEIQDVHKIGAPRRKDPRKRHDRPKTKRAKPHHTTNIRTHGANR
jgi:hypothetical protein